MDFLKMALPPEVLASMPPEELDGSLSMTLNNEDRVNRYNADIGSLIGVDCPECRNKGLIGVLDEAGNFRVRECRCMAKRRSLRLIERSGLSNLLGRYSFDTWQTPEPWHDKLLTGAKDYASAPVGWFFVSGRPGTGKTHICTAVCKELLDAGIEVRYLLWRDFAVRAKALTTDAAAYSELLEPLKNVRVLYIDDFLKVQHGQKPTAGDINLAFELVNARYNDIRLVTLLSTELSISELADLDEALASRIYERARGRVFELKNASNWRLRP